MSETPATEAETSTSTSTPDAASSASDQAPSDSSSSMSLTKQQEIGIGIGVFALVLIVFGYLYYKKKLCFKPKTSVWKDDEEHRTGGRVYPRKSKRARANQQEKSDEEEESEIEELESDQDDEDEEKEEAEEKPIKKSSNVRVNDSKRLSRPVTRSERATKALSTIKEKVERDESRLTSSAGTIPKSRPKSTVQKARVRDESDEESEVGGEDVEEKPRPRSKARRN
ncbi:hypothetical protein BD324DRAFT_647670 [Kockovaella imperatae]|uniref:Uncharacterized protein n=1 Tax=Kockovaella imperatae TaxID=4999 RepID=A0A1Y1USZ9_9TREE|nr:hypothetical protein BD324DRAFT_647670 [Kockovaella imperatae]ORX40757.1 hypothetical protein BD324DRAFT_647670 [Kockovaella imperatae]